MERFVGIQMIRLIPPSASLVSSTRAIAHQAVQHIHIHMDRQFNQSRPVWCALLVGMQLLPGRPATHARMRSCKHARTHARTRAHAVWRGMVRTQAT